VTIFAGRAIFSGGACQAAFTCRAGRAPFAGLPVLAREAIFSSHAVLAGGACQAAFTCRAGRAPFALRPAKHSHIVIPAFATKALGDAASNTASNCTSYAGQSGANRTMADINPAVVVLIPNPQKSRCFLVPRIT
jgi:hypothetical protein